VPWGARQRGGHRGLQAIGGYQSGYQWPFYWAFLMIPWAHNPTTFLPACQPACQPIARFRGSEYRQFWKVYRSSVA